MNYTAFLKTELRHPDLSSYRAEDGTTSIYADSYSAGWYRGEGEQLASTVRTLLRELKEKDEEIERLRAERSE